MARIKNFLTPQWLKEFEELKRQAASNKREAQATSKRSRRKHKRKPEPSSGSQASWCKHQAPSSKAQASSPEYQAPWLPSPHKVLQG